MFTGFLLFITGNFDFLDFRNRLWVNEWWLVKMFIYKCADVCDKLPAEFLHSTLHFLILLIKRLPQPCDSPLSLFSPWSAKVHHAINYANILNTQEAAGSPNKMACISFYLFHTHTCYVLCQILGYLIPLPTPAHSIFAYLILWKICHLEKANTHRFYSTHPHIHTPITYACHPSLI